jgi:hypothetical protein
MVLTHESLAYEVQTTVEDTKSLTSHQATHAVLSTNEFLCNIAIHLPFHDLVTAA